MLFTHYELMKQTFLRRAALLTFVYLSQGKSGR